MSDLNSLTSEIEKLRSNAQAKRDEADRLRAASSNYSVNGYADKAKADLEASERAEQDATMLEQQATQKESEARVVSDKIRDLQSQVTKLESEILSLSGGSNSLL